ncbi:MAG: T9SS type A sorting domain-containing protein [Bacteroidota bacterium]|nr:T9SS type A sorting domain-containing protein [Bacteroidota bacterium]
MKFTTTNIFSLTLALFLFVGFSLKAQWTQLGNTMNSVNSGEKVGASLNLSDDAQTVILGGEYADYNGTNSGVARVFKWDGSNNWIQKGSDIVGNNADDRFGHSVCISDDGNIIAVGASSLAGNSADPGYVKVYIWNGTAWIQRGSTIAGNANGDRFGYSLSMNDDGNVIAIGSIGAGQVRVYDWDGLDWIQKGGNISGIASYWFGNAIELTGDGNNLIIGMKFYNIFRGGVKVYNWTGTAWEQKGQTIEGQDNYDEVGHDVAISDNGNIIGFGAVGCCNSNSKAGMVKIYEYNGATWEQKGSEIPGLDNFDQFGARISMNAAGNRIAAADHTVSASTYDWNGNDWYLSGGWINGGSMDTGLEFDVSLSGSGKELAFGDVTTMNQLGYYGTAKVFELIGEVSLNEINFNNEFELFPNPTNGEFIIKLNHKNTIIRLVDPLGKILHEESNNNKSEITMNIDAPRGIYFIFIIQDNAAMKSIKVVKN